MLHPSEARARLEIVKTAIRRLLDAEGPKGRRELFHSDSRQSMNATWHRQVLAELERRGLVERTGASRGVRYAIVSSPIDEDAWPYEELDKLARDSGAIAELLQAAISAGRSAPTEGVDPETEPAEVAEADEDPTFHQVLSSIAENLDFIRECVATFDQRLRRLEEAWFGESKPESASESRPQTNGVEGQ